MATSRSAGLTRKRNWVRIEGMPLLTRRLRTLEAKLQKKVIRQAIRKSLKPIQQDAKREAPKNTGALRKSVKIRSFKRSRVRVGAKVTTGTATSDFKGDEFYGAFVNYGTKHIRGNRWLNKVAKKNKRKARRIFTEHVRAGIKAHK